MTLLAQNLNLNTSLHTINQKSGVSQSFLTGLVPNNNNMPTSLQSKTGTIMTDNAPEMLVKNPDTQKNPLLQQTKLNSPEFKDGAVLLSFNHNTNHSDDLGIGFIKSLGLELSQQVSDEVHDLVTTAGEDPNSIIAGDENMIILGNKHEPGSTYVKAHEQALNEELKEITDELSKETRTLGETKNELHNLQIKLYKNQNKLIQSPSNEKEYNQNSAIRAEIYDIKFQMSCLEGDIASLKSEIKELKQERAERRTELTDIRKNGCTEITGILVPNDQLENAMNDFYAARSSKWQPGAFRTPLLNDLANQAYEANLKLNTFFGDSTNRAKWKAGFQVMTSFLSFTAGKLGQMANEETVLARNGLDAPIPKENTDNINSEGWFSWFAKKVDSLIPNLPVGKCSELDGTPNQFWQNDGNETGLVSKNKIEIDRIDLNDFTGINELQYELSEQEQSQYRRSLQESKSTTDFPKFSTTGTTQSPTIELPSWYNDTFQFLNGDRASESAPVELIENVRNYLKENPLPETAEKLQPHEAQLYAFIHNEFIKSNPVINDHIAWHSVHGSGGTTGTGSGQEFLDFHRGMISDLKNYMGSWNETVLPLWTKFDSNITDIIPMPDGIRRNEVSGAFSMPSYLTKEGGTDSTFFNGKQISSLNDIATIDELGRIIGTRFHGIGHFWIGGTMSGFASPRDPIFYTWHGALDNIINEWLETEAGQTFLQTDEGQQWLASLPTLTGLSSTLQHTGTPTTNSPTSSTRQPSFSPTSSTRQPSFSPTSSTRQPSFSPTSSTRQPTSTPTDSTNQSSNFTDSDYFIPVVVVTTIAVIGIGLCTFFCVKGKKSTQSGVAPKTDNKSKQNTDIEMQRNESENKSMVNKKPTKEEDTIVNIESQPILQNSSMVDEEQEVVDDPDSTS